MFESAFLSAIAPEEFEVGHRTTPNASTCLAVIRLGVATLLVEHTMQTGIFVGPFVSRVSAEKMGCPRLRVG
jgi:hypothetical protein